MVNRNRPITVAMVVLLSSIYTVVYSVYLAFVIRWKCSTDWRNFFAGLQSESDMISIHQTQNYSLLHNSTVNLQVDLLHV